jgi:heat shock protein HslJ
MAFREAGQFLHRVSLFPACLALVACTSDDRAQPPTSYRAIGQEPGWTVTISDQRIDYVGDYGETRISVPAPSPRPTFNGHRYETERLIVDITNVACTDAMNGRRYADEVRVIADGKEVHGCGGEPLTDA